MEFEHEIEESHKQDLTNLRVLERLIDLSAKEKIPKIQEVDQSSITYISHDNTESNWVAPDGPLYIPESNFDLLDVFDRGVGVGLMHTDYLMIRKKIARETEELELEGKILKTGFRTFFWTIFRSPRLYSNKIVVIHSDFILTERTCAEAIANVITFKAALAADS